MFPPSPAKSILLISVSTDNGGFVMRRLVRAIFV